MRDVAIKVQNVSKLYRIGEREPYKALRDTLTDAIYAPFRQLKRISNFDSGNSKSPIRNSNSDYIWALKDVSFEIKRGEVVGMIGRNGAGKSTLLKILSRITEPTEGYAAIHGRVGSLLEVGTGFHPELTGRENIYLNGAILGMKKAEIERKFDEIVAFAEIEKFMDTPVKRYSSGMYLRLAFAVAAHLEPEILLVDEVLAVGDAAFQKKCLGKMGDVAKEGRTVLFVSHNMAAIEGLCRSAYMLDQARLVMSGKTRDIVEAYISSLTFRDNRPLDQRADRQGNGRLRFTDIIFLSTSGTPTEVVQCGQDLNISIGYRSDMHTLQNVAVSIGVFTLSGQCMVVLNNQMLGTDFDSIPSVGQVSCLIERLPLAPGQYYLNLYCEVNGMIGDWIQRAACLTVEAGDFFGTGRLPPQAHGGLLVHHNWRLTSSETEGQQG